MYFSLKKHITAHVFPSAALLSLSLLMPLTAQACASCGCTLSSDWENLGFSSSSGFKIDVRYDYLNQNQLRTGAHSASPSASAAANPDAEIEKYTRNNYLTVGLDYSVNPNWGINVQLPFINRNHTTLGTVSDGINPGMDAYHSSTSSIGDIKAIGRYQGFTEQHNFGLLLGLKLPTGSHTKTGISIDPDPDPAVAGTSAAIDRGLQPGTGTTDAIFGAYYLDSFNKDWGYFSQAIVQKPLNSSDGYKPGDSLNLNLGLRYQGFDDFTPQLQLNARLVEHDHSKNEVDYATGTGGTLVYLSPGATLRINKQIKVYGYVQVPIYQDVNDLQLTPRWTASLGANYTF